MMKKSNQPLNLYLPPTPPNPRTKFVVVLCIVDIFLRTVDKKEAAVLRTTFGYILRSIYPYINHHHLYSSSWLKGPFPIRDIKCPLEINSYSPAWHTLPLHSLQKNPPPPYIHTAKKEIMKKFRPHILPDPLPCIHTNARYEPTPLKNTSLFFTAFKNGRGRRSDLTT